MPRFWHTLCASRRLAAWEHMKMKKICLLLSVLFLAIGLGAMFAGHGQSTKLDIIQGIAKGLAGVFFILYYILMLLGKQPTDKTAADHY